MPLGITLIPSSISFGSVNVGMSSPQTLNIQATGFGPFSITSVSNSDGQFSSNITAGVLNTGANNFTVSFSPASTGTFSDTFAIMILDASTTDTTEYDLPVDGSGASPPPPATGSFVSVTQTD